MRQFAATPPDRAPINQSHQSPVTLREGEIEGKQERTLRSHTVNC